MKYRVQVCCTTFTYCDFWLECATPEEAKDAAIEAAMFTEQDWSSGDVDYDIASIEEKP